MKNKICLFFGLLISLTTYAQDINYNQLKEVFGQEQLAFLPMSEQVNLFIDKDEANLLRRNHNQYLREPLYDDYLHANLIAMQGLSGFQHLFRNLGGGFVPIRVEENLLIIKGTRDHCGGMEEAMVLVDLTSGDITSLLYSEDNVIIHSSYNTAEQLPLQALLWIKRLLDAYGTRQKPTRNKILLRKMAGDWCRPD
ncbi:hypothetical protein [Neptuniibacter caesariensis]|uniref:Uncharacterized protein n=1 Tax=Neptuniibacter caesariensis TaxID=207954 RepID=A0A7U8C5N6_NEPCE|nr:hypothetical protein [Neptuniibacter caesariensis]EAR61156.1 hypothetical protein MED92_04859 [Oceanospirillum sp. MED92] [Neptuniibacter caesariensis]